MVMHLIGIAQDLKDTDLIPFDSAVKIGKLENGLTYYIRKNAKPENKVDIRLVVNAGSILEDDDQQGLAHFLEHMGFNGTKNFPKNELVGYLQSIGVKFAHHLNAVTSYDETVYFLPIPSDDSVKLEKGFQIIEDWAFNMSLDSKAIDDERAVVLEEMRLRNNADMRMAKKFMPKIFYKSQYPNRFPIGQKEILQNFKPEKIRKFYKDWYRPNLMAVIVVGDIDVAEIEKKIIDHFSAYENPKNERPRKVFEVPDHVETFVAIETDKEASESKVQLIYKDYNNVKSVHTINDLKISTKHALYSLMLNQRLTGLTKLPKTPFVNAGVYYGSTIVSKNAYAMTAITQNRKQLEALKALVDENNRIKKYGFTGAEFEYAKDQLMRQTYHYYEQDKTNSGDFAKEYQSNFLEKKPIPDKEWSYNAIQQITQQMTVKEIDRLVNGYIKNDNCVVVFTGPEKENIKKPTEQEVLAILNQNIDDIEPYEEGKIAESLLRKKINSGSIVKKEINTELGTTTLYLSNGAKVTYKKTDFKSTEILMEAVSFGGTNLYTNEEYKKTLWANKAFAEAGFSGLKRKDIDGFLKNKLVSVVPYIDDVFEGFKGSSAPQHIENIFQMIHAYFTDLNFDEEAYESFKMKKSVEYNNRASVPLFYFEKEYHTYLNKDNPRFNGIYPNEQSWAETDYKLAYEKFRERFDNVADFEFFFVGTMDDEVLEEFAAKYIASLPSNNKREKVVDLGYRVKIKGNTKKKLRKGVEPFSYVVISYTGETTYDPKEAITLEALGGILTIKLLENLREKSSGVYVVDASGSIENVPYGLYKFVIQFPCGPENAKKLTKAALHELEQIIHNGPEAADLSKYKEAELLEHRKNMKENQPWLDNLVKTYTHGRSAEEILEFEDRVKAITLKDVQNVAKKYLDKNKSKFVATLMPEKN